MSAITSELYIKSSSLVDEKICVGLFVVTENAAYFDYSKKKLSLSFKLVKSLNKNSVTHWLENLKATISEAHRNDELGLFRSDFNKATLSYLNTYSKGTFYFSEPKPIAAEIDSEYYYRLFERLVDSEMGVILENDLPNFKAKVRSIIKREAFKKIDTSYKVLPEIVSSIYAPHIIDFIGKNGNILAGDSIDFNAMPATIDKSLFEFERISRGLKELAIHRGLEDVGKYYAYFAPPESAEGKKVLDFAIRDKNKNFELKEFDHLEKLSESIEASPFRKFSEWISD